MLTNSLDAMRRLLGAFRGVSGTGFSASTRDGEPVAGGHLIYRLKAWPDLPEIGRTAEIYRMLSLMSQRPVNRQWVLSQTRMDRGQLEQLLLQLVHEGSIEVIDPARFAGREPCRA